jgi:serine/threonine protein kinase
VSDTTIDKHFSAEDLAEKISKTGLLSADEIRSAMGTLSGESSILNGVILAERLVSEGKLTSFQASAVLEERVEELRIGNYDVLERLGAGAMGTVYKARHRRMKRIVAIKVLSRTVTRPSFIQRFQREVETLAQLIHPNVIMAFDADEADVGHFLVMEFVDGRDLASVVQRNGRLPLIEAIDMIEQSAQGLEYAHQKGIVHRDIKPANIMRDSGGLVKVADLGLARLVKAGDDEEANSLTQAGSIVGTVDYMAPEQALDSSAIDHRADIYSLGCTFYFLLTGQPPYPGNSVMSALLKHRESEIPSLRALRPDAPAELETLVRQMLAKHPNDRTASMSIVLQSLRQIKANLSSPPASSSTASPTGKPMTVILVEPSRVQASIVRKQLLELGIEKVHPATSGAAAVELAKLHDAQAMISTMQLPDMTGLQLAHAIRGNGAHANLGLILMASDTEAQDVAELRSIPRTALVSKPFDAQKLAAALAAATGRSVGNRS